MPARSRKPAAEKVRLYRERLRAQRLRPLQVWVPDVRSAGFRQEAHRQSRALAESPRESADQAFVDVVSDRDDE
jgi:hypothetical protein